MWAPHHHHKMLTAQYLPVNNECIWCIICRYIWIVYAMFISIKPLHNSSQQSVGLIGLKGGESPGKGFPLHSALQSFNLRVCGDRGLHCGPTRFWETRVQSGVGIIWLHMLVFIDQWEWPMMLSNTWRISETRYLKKENKEERNTFIYLMLSLIFKSFCGLFFSLKQFFITDFNTLIHFFYLQIIKIIRLSNILFY